MSILKWWQCSAECSHSDNTLSLFSLEPFDHSRDRKLSSLCICLYLVHVRVQHEDALAQAAFEEARRRTRDFEDRDRSHREDLEVRGPCRGVTAQCSPNCNRTNLLLPYLSLTKPAWMSSIVILLQDSFWTCHLFPSICPLRVVLVYCGLQINNIGTFPVSFHLKTVAPLTTTIFIVGCGEQHAPLHL